MHVIYKWFVGLYHENLYNFLAGFDCDFYLTGTNQFNGVIGIGTIAIALLFACLFYFVRHTRFNGILSWLVVLAIVALLSWSFGFGIVKSQENDMPNYVRYGVENCSSDGSYTEDAEDYYDGDGTGEQSDANTGCNSLQPNDGAQPQLTPQTYIGFGFANMLIGVIWFFLFSVVLKRFSPSCRHTPWPSFWPKH